MSPQPVRLSRHHSVAWLLAPAVLLAAPVIGLGVGRLIDGPDELERASGETADWTLPLAFVAAVVALFVIFWVVSFVVLRATERRDVRRVLAAPIARWPQFASDEQWRGFVSRDRESERTNARLLRLAPVGAVATAVGGLALGAALGSAMIGGAFGGFAAGLILAGSASRLRSLRQRRALDAHRDRLVGIPHRTVSLRGVLDDDLGVTAFTQLAGAVHVPSADLGTRRAATAAARRRGDVIANLDPIDRQLAKAGWSFLELTFDQRVARGFAANALRLLEQWHARSTGMRWVQTIRVPPDASAEADAVATALTARYRLDSGSPDPTG